MPRPPLSAKCSPKRPAPPSAPLKPPPAPPSKPRLSLNPSSPASRPNPTTPRPGNQSSSRSPNLSPSPSPCALRLPSQPRLPLLFHPPTGTKCPNHSRSAPARASHGASIFEAPDRDSWGRPQHLPSPLETEGFELVEPALPIHANLIEFPRELVATRKVRPRRAEGPYAQSVEAQGQLSIFEVDPGSISIDVPAGAAVAATNTVIGPRWSGIELDEEPQHEELVLPEPAAAAQAEPIATAPAPARELELAPTHQRLMAALVDFSLISASFIASALAASSYAKVLPPIREIEIGSAVALALIAVLYQAVFCTLASATPGMKYARLELRTFAGQKPARAQRLVRMAVLLLSLLPAGLGVLWSLFDEQHLCWHDRLSRTYPRKA